MQTKATSLFATLKSNCSCKQICMDFIDEGERKFLQKVKKWFSTKLVIQLSEIINTRKALFFCDSFCMQLHLQLPFLFVKPYVTLIRANAFFPVINKCAWKLILSTTWGTLLNGFPSSNRSQGLKTSREIAYVVLKWKD